MSRFGVNNFRNNRMSNQYGYGGRFGGANAYNTATGASRFGVNSPQSHNHRLSNRNAYTANKYSTAPSPYDQRRQGFNTAQKRQNRPTYGYYNSNGYNSPQPQPGQAYYNNTQNKRSGTAGNTRKPRNSNLLTNFNFNNSRQVKTPQAGAAQYNYASQNPNNRYGNMKKSSAAKLGSSVNKSKLAAQVQQQQQQQAAAYASNNNVPPNRRQANRIGLTRQPKPNNYQMPRRPQTTEKKPKRPSRKKRHTTAGGKKSVNYEVTQSNESSKGIVRAFGICTTQGIVRDYNEDRVSVILNVSRDEQEQDIKHNQRFSQVHNSGGEFNRPGPKCSFFSVIDGHGGNGCANFLREKLHHYILNDTNFPLKCPEAIKNGIQRAEDQFLKNAVQGKNNVDRSGACCLIALFRGKTNQANYFLDQECYLGNVGDCRAILSSKFGQKHSELTVDHKPESPSETKRIVAAGGYVYQTPIPRHASPTGKQTFGPQRVMPGKLSVARTIGDIFAKDPRWGGNPKVVIPTPDIYLLTIKQDDDFIILGSE